MRLRALACAALGAIALVPAARAADPVQPYGKNDAGGFRNVLPPGTAGTDNAFQLGEFRTMGDRPPHWMDQLGLYTGLMYASPKLKHSQIARYFKDATFGVRPGQVASVESPRPGLSIVRDKPYGVPHIYGATRADIAFGTGYVAAEDRLFLIDVLRHTGRAQLSSFAGGAESNRRMDREQWQLAPYTEDDLQKQIDNAPKLYGTIGDEFVQDGKDYVDGINKYIDEALLDPTKMPAEYGALGIQLQHWKLTDVVATASLIGGIFGRGGGREVASSELVRAFEQRFGVHNGHRIWHDFRSKDDPETPLTVPGRFRYMTGDPFAQRGLARPDRGSVKLTPTAPPPAGGQSKGAFGLDLKRAFDAHRHQSNVLLASARESATGHAVAVMGPQVGYYVPQILMEEDLHGPGFDATGAAFPGVNLYVQLGHGRDYAWSATTANSDLVDTFAEVLCQDDVHYLYKGKCLPMTLLSRHNSWHPNASDSTPPGSETLSAYRTVHGIVYARGTVKGRRVAFASARSTYGHEADSALGFALLNDPAKTRGPRSFQKAVSNINFSFNWFYADADHIAYYLSGWYPQRAKHTSPDFPVLGTGAYDWRGWDPNLRVAKWLPYGRHPNAIDPRYIVNWNNRQTKGWKAADDEYKYQSEFRQELLADKVRRAMRGPRKIRIEQMVRADEEAGTQDLRGVKLVPILLRALGRPTGQRLRGATRLLRDWHRHGAHRRDLNKDGHYDDDAAVTLMDAWWPLLLKEEFKHTLGPNVFDQLGNFISQGDVRVGGPATSPDFETGWFGYVSKDLRDMFGPRPRGPWHVRYCGGGGRGHCRAGLRRSLRAALKVKKQELYGHDPTCSNEGRVEASCFDETRSTVAVGIDIPHFPWINRPTFQQTVETKRRLPR